MEMEALEWCGFFFFEKWSFKMMDENGGLKLKMPMKLMYLVKVFYIMNKAL